MDHLQAAMLGALEQRTGAVFERDWLSLQLETYRVEPGKTEDSSFRTSSSAKSGSMRQDATAGTGTAVIT